MLDGHERNEEKPSQRPYPEEPAGIAAPPSSASGASGRLKTKAECWEAFWKVAAHAHADRCRREAAERAAQLASGESSVEGDGIKPGR